MEWEALVKLAAHGKPAIVAGWLPVLLYFLKNWKRRGNPLSLAIAGLVVATAAEGGAVSLVVLVNFYLAWLLARRWFPDERRRK